MKQLSIVSPEFPKFRVIILYCLVGLSLSACSLITEKSLSGRYYMKRTNVEYELLLGADGNFIFRNCLQNKYSKGTWLTDRVPENPRVVLYAAENNGFLIFKAFKQNFNARFMHIKETIWRNHILIINDDFGLYFIQEDEISDNFELIASMCSQ